MSHSSDEYLYGGVKRREYITQPSPRCETCGQFIKKGHVHEIPIVVDEGGDCEYLIRCDRCWRAYK